MKEIKFRAWDIKRKGYIQGFNMVNYHGYFNKGLKKSIYRYNTEWEEGKYILEQYANLQDKNDEEYYRGDVFIDSRNGNRYKVAQSAGAFWAEPIDRNLMCESYSLVLLCHVNELSKIIGNVHENPELLG